MDKLQVYLHVYVMLGCLCMSKKSICKCSSLLINFISTSTFGSLYQYVLWFHQYLFDYNCGGFLVLSRSTKSNVHQSKKKKQQ